jgi:predicted transcriptional regulator
MALNAAWNDESIKQFAEEYKSLGSSALAKKYGVSTQTIRYHLKRLGIDRVKPGRPRKYVVEVAPQI